MWWMHYLPSAHFHTAMLCAASMPTVTRSLPLQLKFTAHTPLVWNPCMTDKVSLDVASHTWTQGSVPIWPVATMFCQTQHNYIQNTISKWLQPYLNFISVYRGIFVYNIYLISMSDAVSKGATKTFVLNIERAQHNFKLSKGIWAWSSEYFLCDAA